MQLIDNKLLLFGGKGGVGKTSCAAATALYAASKGRTSGSWLKGKTERFIYEQIVPIYELNIPINEITIKKGK